MGINLFNLGLGNTIGGITTGEFTPPIDHGRQRQLVEFGRVFGIGGRRRLPMS